MKPRLFFRNGFWHCTTKLGTYYSGVTIFDAYSFWHYGTGWKFTRSNAK